MEGGGSQHAERLGGKREVSFTGAKIFPHSVHSVDVMDEGGTGMFYLQALNISPHSVSSVDVMDGGNGLSPVLFVILQSKSVCLDYFS